MSALKLLLNPLTCVRIIPTPSVSTERDRLSVSVYLVTFLMNFKVDLASVRAHAYSATITQV